MYRLGLVIAIVLAAGTASAATPLLLQHPTLSSTDIAFDLPARSGRCHARAARPGAW